jgi:hypothetical protein
LKTIVVMAGGCALQASPRKTQPPDLTAAPRKPPSSKHEASLQNAARLIRLESRAAKN